MIQKGRVWTPIWKGQRIGKWQHSLKDIKISPFMILFKKELRGKQAPRTKANIFLSGKCCSRRALISDFSQKDYCPSIIMGTMPPLLLRNIYGKLRRMHR